MSFLKEDNGNFSSARLIALICCVSGCFCAVAGVWRGCDDLLGLSTLATGIISAGAGFKVLQKKNEANK